MLKKRYQVFAFSSEQQIFHIMTHFQYFVRIEREIVRPRDCDQNSESGHVCSRVLGVYTVYPTQRRLDRSLSDKADTKKAKQEHGQ